MNQQQNISQIKVQMQKGTAISTLLHGPNSTHYADALERFQKDFASHDYERREQEKMKRQMVLEKKRTEQLERENQRWEKVERKHEKENEKEAVIMQLNRLGLRKNPTSNSLAYNPINLSYNQNSEGLKLKHRDEDKYVNRYVRAHNMDSRGDSNYNPLNGCQRLKVDDIVPGDLTERYRQKLNRHYNEINVKAPCSSVQMSRMNHYDI